MTDPAGPLQLIVTADDFGIGIETSRGIVDSHLRGPVTATSFMAITGDHAAASVPFLTDTPDMDVGLHLVFTRCGHAPAVAGRSSGLVGRDGHFLSNGKLWVRACLGRLDRFAITDEIAAQTDLFRKLLGRTPDYVDGHHHAHQLPIIRDALADVMRRGDLPAVTRKTVEPAEFRPVKSARIRRAAAGWLGRGWQRTQAVSAWTNDGFFGMLDPADMARPFPWDSYFARMPVSGVVEWVVHPGRADDTLAGRDDYRAARVAELAALTDPLAWDRFRPMLTRKSFLARRTP